MQFIETTLGTFRCECVDCWRDAGIPHGFLGRDLNFAVDSRAASVGQLCSTLDLSSLALLKQEHTKVVIEASDSPAQLENAPVGDALIAPTPSPRRALGVLIADCMPVLLVSRTSKAVAAVHCGWRGAQSGILVEAIMALCRKGVPIRSLEVAVGPGAQPCCYEIGADVKSKLSAAFSLVNAPPASGVVDAVMQREGKFWGNLKDLLIAQAFFCGVPRAQILASETCTICHEQYFSYRREKDLAGRQVSFVARP